MEQRSGTPDFERAEWGGPGEVARAAMAGRPVLAENVPMAETTALTGEPATPTQALRADIAQTRDALGETVQALAAKVDVKARVRESAGEAVADLRARADHVRRQPAAWVALAAVVAAVVAIIVVRERRSR